MNPLLHKDLRRLPTFAPPIDIRDRGDSLTIQADLPGVGREDVDIVVDHQVLSILARCSMEADSKFVAVHEEFRPSHFFRSFILTEELETDGIRADLENGVLTVWLPKRGAPIGTRIAEPSDN